MKMMSAMAHLLFQNKNRMVQSGSCTSQQYDHGRVELLTHLTRFFDSKQPKGFTYSASNNAPSNNAPSSNQWSDGKDKDMLVSESVVKAQNELEKRE